jgi:hypothetical protein
MRSASGEEQEQLDYMTTNSSWYRLHQKTQSGGEIDVTEQAKESIRRAIEDYRQAIEYLKSED